MRRAGVILLSVALFALSSVRLDSSEWARTRIARAEKGDLSYVTQAAAAEPASGVAESEDHFEWRSAAAYAAFEDIWIGSPDQQRSPVQEQILTSAAPDISAEWAFAPSTLMKPTNATSSSHCKSASYAAVAGANRGQERPPLTHNAHAMRTNLVRPVLG